MAWTTSKIFAVAVMHTMDRTSTGGIDWDTDTFKAALYDNDITPDNSVAAGSAAYNTGQWAISGNEVIDTTGGGTDWPAGGRPLVNNDVTQATTTVKFDADDTFSVGASADIAAAFGCLVYDDSVTAPTADLGVCYNYFGGTNSVTNGTFTIVWSGSGICSFSVA
jgi:hypothetical protein